MTLAPGRFDTQQAIPRSHGAGPLRRVDAAKVLAMLKEEVNEALEEISKHWTERG